MTYREWAPGADLADRVACFWTRDVAAPGDGPDAGSGPEPAPIGAPDGASGAGEAGGAGESGVTRVLPDGCIDIIRGPEGLQVAGPDTRVHPVPTRPGDRYVAVRFLPGGAGPIFDCPADALTDGRIPLPELWGASDGWMEAWEAPPEGPADLVRLGAMVRSRVGARGPADPAAATARRALAAGLPVSRVADDLGFSERQLRRRATAAFGYGPKMLQRILRFQQALELARRGTDLARVAHDCGYADQAHLAGEVRCLAGAPLTALR